MKKNSSENYEPLNVYLTPDKTPVAYQNKVTCLMDSGLSESQARVLALEPIELELYYEVGSGLFAVESEAVESGCICSPYSGEVLEDDNEGIPASDVSANCRRLFLSRGKDVVDTMFKLVSLANGMLRQELLSWLTQRGCTAPVPPVRDDRRFVLNVLGQQYNDFNFSRVDLLDNVIHFYGYDEDGNDVSMDESELPDNGLLYICDYLFNGNY